MFFHRGSVITWNELPEQLVAVDAITMFKRNLDRKVEDYEPNGGK